METTCTDKITFNLNSIPVESAGFLLSVLHMYVVEGGLGLVKCAEMIYRRSGNCHR